MSAGPRTSQGRRIWEARPPKRAYMAQCAWDWFEKEKCTPKQVWFHSFDGWEMWVAEFPDGETDEIEASHVRYKIRDRLLEAKRCAS